MSGSTPEDLAVAFRSLERRRREALHDLDTAGTASLSGLTTELAGHVRAAAAVLAVGEGDGAAVADAIDARRAEDWDDVTLDRLRRHALDAGAVLRRLTTAADDLRADD